MENNADDDDDDEGEDQSEKMKTKLMSMWNNMKYGELYTVIRPVRLKGRTRALNLTILMCIHA